MQANPGETAGNFRDAASCIVGAGQRAAHKAYTEGPWPQLSASQRGLPISTHGGLHAHSYLLGAEQVIETVRQLRGDAGAAQVATANVGMATGLSVPDYGVLLLGRI